MECRVGRSGEEKEKEVSGGGELVEVVEGKQSELQAEDEIAGGKIEGTREGEWSKEKNTTVRK